VFPRSCAGVRGLAKSVLVAKGDGPPPDLGKPAGLEPAAWIGRWKTGRAFHGRTMDHPRGRCVSEPPSRNPPESPLEGPPRIDVLMTVGGGRTVP